MFLLDTNVISEIRKGRRADPLVRAWFHAHASQSHYLSVMTLGEIRCGIDQIQAKDGAKAVALEIWLTEIKVIFQGRILGIGVDAAERWGRMNSGKKLPEVDGLIAATAWVHGLTVATRNVDDFVRSGVNVVNPWEWSGGAVDEPD